MLLQSSPRDRRVIFEEAAGISRFKMRKIEALRRLERVEQNLLRLSDIVDEVESRLRSVRAQAGKARRYKEHTDRLQELRTQVGLVDWRRLTERLAGFESELQSLGRRSATPPRPRPRTIEAQLLEIDDRHRPRSTRKSARPRRRSPPTASGSPPPSRPSSTSAAAASTWSRRSPATAGNWRP